ncbi:vacuolar sorting protein 39 domain 1-domain-containing protein [Coemansia mojavensis]|nr:vacuolar sorting protein 39 domain 1-domain-containing protein [Coemansia mojavensis]
MAQVVDTTLLKVYLECSPGLLGPLLRVKNYCDVEQSEGLLLERKRYLELVDLYHGKGLYRNALQLLQTQGKSADSGSLHGTYATVRYLVRLPADQFDLIVEYLQWPLQNDEDWPDPTTIVSMVFADDRPAAETFPRSRVASFLHQISPALAIQYLKYVFDTWKDKTPALHDDMVAAYFDMLEEKHSDSDRLSLRVKLQQFLKSSSHYSPERALARLPDDRLFMERALVLSRLGRHEHALGLLVFSVANLALAEQYCVENISQRADIFVLLLKLLVSSPPPKDSVDQIEDKRTEIHRQYVGHLLATYPQSIPVADVLPLLPPDMAFSHDIFVYLRSQLCTLDQDVRTKNVVRSLVAAEDLHARRQLSHLQSNFVVISETRVCPQCLKRIGSGTAFAVVPDERKGQVVVHYSCWQRSRSAVSNGRDVSADDSIASPLDNKPQVEIKWA